MTHPICAVHAFVSATYLCLCHCLPKCVCCCVCVCACVCLCQVRQRYEIDSHLKRPARVIAHLALLLNGAEEAPAAPPVPPAGPVHESTAPPLHPDTVIALARAHKLELEAVEAFPGPAWGPLRRELLLLHGRRLVAEGAFEDAAKVFLSAVPPALYARPWPFMLTFS